MRAPPPRGQTGRPSPEDERSSTAYAEVASEWAREEPEATGSWIEGMETASTRDAAVRSYGEQLLTIDPPGSLAWVDTISDGDS